MNTFRNQFMKTGHPETHEIIVNAELAFERGEITQEQKWDAIRIAITAESEKELTRRDDL